MTEEAKPPTIYNLVAQMENYTLHHRHSRDVIDRWFAEHLEAVIIPRGRRIRSGGLDDDERKQVGQFRLMEIEKEKTEKQREIDRLDAEAKKLTAA